jgi:hypothetical protein
MERIKCITFDKEAQNNLPDEIKAKMKANQEGSKKPKDETLPCPCCQGGGCPFCVGYGTIPA